MNVCVCVLNCKENALVTEKRVKYHLLESFAHISCRLLFFLSV